jgi:septum formation protein
VSNQLYLASNSPRRAQLLSQIGLDFKLVNGDIDETPNDDETPREFVVRMASEKALAGLQNLNDPNAWVIGGDTVLVFDNQVIGKPVSKVDFVTHFSRLSGKWHDVLSAVSLVNKSNQTWVVNHTRVKLKPLTTDEILNYWECGEPIGKAGGYAIQGRGAIYIERIEGSYSAVMGLPVYELNQLLTESGFYE